MGCGTDQSKYDCQDQHPRQLSVVLVVLFNGEWIYGKTQAKEHNGVEPELALGLSVVSLIKKAEKLLENIVGGVVKCISADANVFADVNDADDEDQTPVTSEVEGKLLKRSQFILVLLFNVIEHADCDHAGEQIACKGNKSTV